MLLAKDWKDYKILDMSNGQKVESWGNIILTRPDPQIVWNEKQNPDVWKKSNAVYHRSNKGGGCWEQKTKTPYESLKKSYDYIKENVHIWRKIKLG